MHALSRQMLKARFLIVLAVSYLFAGERIRFISNCKSTIVGKCGSFHPSGSNVVIGGVLVFLCQQE